MLYSINEATSHTSTAPETNKGNSFNDHAAASPRKESKARKSRPTPMTPCKTKDTKRTGVGNKNKGSKNKSSKDNKSKRVGHLDPRLEGLCDELFASGGGSKFEIRL